LELCKDFVDEIHWLGIIIKNSWLLNVFSELNDLYFSKNKYSKYFGLVFRFFYIEEQYSQDQNTCYIYLWKNTKPSERIICTNEFCCEGFKTVNFVNKIFAASFKTYGSKEECNSHHFLFF